jgi:hypothetical protein
MQKTEAHLCSFEDLVQQVHVCIFTFLVSGLNFVNLQNSHYHIHHENNEIAAMTNDKEHTVKMLSSLCLFSPAE